MIVIGLCIGFGLALWTILHLIFYSLTAKFVDMSKMDLPTKLDMGEKLVSCTHGIIVASIAVYSVFIAKHFEHDIAFTYNSEYHDTLFSLCLSYQLYDLVLMSIQRTSGWPMFLHHFVAVLGCAFVMWYKVMTFYPTIFIISEYTVVPNNILWYIRVLKVDKNHWFHKFIFSLRTFAVYTTRTWIAPYALYLGYLDGHHDLIFEIDPLARYVLIFNVGFLSLLNTYWSLGATWVLFQFWRSMSKLE